MIVGVTVEQLGSLVLDRARTSLIVFVNHSWVILGRSWHDFRPNLGPFSRFQGGPGGSGAVLGGLGAAWGDMDRFLIEKSGSLDLPGLPESIQNQ